MNKLKINSSIDKVREFSIRNPFVFPIFLLGIAVVTYGVFIFSLGFYWDDWPPLLLSHIADKTLIWKYFISDRPFQSWTYYLLFPICRDSAFLWHLSAILFRWTSALTLYYSFVKIFPKQKVLFQWAAILFLVFPGFADQYVAVVFTSVFLTYTVFGLSIYTMVLAIQNKNRFWLFFPLSIALTCIHLFTMEYFVGLEVLRPILILIILSRVESSRAKTILRTIKYWLPYFAVLAFFIYWRVILYPAAIGGNQDNNYPFIFAKFLSAPTDTLIKFAQTIFSDLRFLLLSGWTDRLWPNELQIASITFWLSIAIGLMVGFVYVFLFKNKEKGPLILNTKEACINIGLSALILFCGMFPIWSTLRQVSNGKWTDRFDLPAIFGVVLLISTLVFAAIQKQKVRNAIFIILVGLSISYHIRIGSDYRRDFLRQEAFYVQLKWRMPALVPGTTLYSPGVPTPKEADYSYSMGINLLYNHEDINTSFDYWLSSPRYFKPEALVKDPTFVFEQKLRIYDFQGSAAKIISINLPSTGCLWVVDPYYALMPVKIAGFPLYGELTNQNLIVDQLENSNGLSKIFDFSPQKTWCYYFEKGDLAQSKGDFEKAISFYDQAMVEKLVPLEGIEYLPFIKSYAKTDRFDEALSLSQQALNLSIDTSYSLCQLWHDIQAENPNSSDSSVETIYNSVNCPAFFNTVE